MQKRSLSLNLPVAIIDSHCHGRDMNQRHKTTVEQTLIEAMMGGIGTTVFMPNTDPAIINIETLDHYVEIIETAKKNLGIKRRQYLYFGLTDHNLSECEKALKHPMVVGLKDYPKSASGKTVTTGTIGVSDNDVRLEAMRLVRKHRKVYARHCDNPQTIEEEGHTTTAEAIDISNTTILMEKVPGLKAVICHVSSKSSAEFVLYAQKNGLKMALEICPHYLWFDAEGTHWKKGLDLVFYKCFNNLRSAADREYLVNLLKTDNPLIFISSDNAGHTPYEKVTKGMGGLPSNQEMVAVICTLAHQHKIPEKRVAELLSWNAAKHLGINVPRKLVPHRLEWHTDRIKYNDGTIVNPWDGSTMLFPIKEE